MKDRVVGPPGVGTIADDPQVVADQCCGPRWNGPVVRELKRHSSCPGLSENRVGPAWDEPGLRGTAYPSVVLPCPSNGGARRHFVPSHGARAA
eukprot:6091809-Lingulodinium_polyedra.AAC.1